jgi:biotin transport system permease protein
VVTFAVMVGGLQTWSAGPLAGLVAGSSLLVAVVMAAVVTLTTRTQDLLDALVTAVRPLRHVGVAPERVALVLALAVRSVPVMAGLAAMSTRPGSPGVPGDRYGRSPSRWPSGP